MNVQKSYTGTCKRTVWFYKLARRKPLISNEVETQAVVAIVQK